MRTACWSWLFVAAATIAGAAEPPTPKSEAPKLELPRFELFDGDRVVFLGNTLIEREQKYGYWELMLTMAWPERNVTFRNLGWSGDTVWGESRAGFGTQADGFKVLVNQVNAAKPTVIFVGYGNVEAFDGEAGLPKFIDGFNKLLDELEKTKARIVVLGPVHQNGHITPNSDWPQINKLIRTYSEAMLKECERREVRFVPLAAISTLLYDVSPRNEDEGGAPSTKAGDLTAMGYMFLFKNGIAAALRINAKTSLPTTPEGATAYVSLTRAIEIKNELFFHRWRPQNETYLFGFRKHEQGKNAEEVFAFDPLIEAEEKKIAELRVKLAAEMKKASNADAK